jgi:oligosaccharide repeat unit polymerase
MKSITLAKRTILLHPLVVFSLVWFSVVFLYSLHLSKLLLYSTNEVISVTAFIWVPFAAVILAFGAFYHFFRMAYGPTASPARPLNLHLLERRITVWFRIWLCISAFEILISGGIPMVWLLQHSAKTYVDFGIPSLHGLVNSLIISIGICRLALFFITGRKSHLIVPVFVAVWSILVVTRQLLLVSLLEFGVVFLAIKRVKATTLARLAIVALIFILIFGFVGDLRSGSDAFRVLAQPTDQYPSWLPSGLLWGYIYITTPINNLLYTVHSVQPLGSLLFPNTATTLFPTVIRNVLYGNSVGQAESGNLVTQAFNVSTAYVGPYQDLGFVGILVFSAATAFACQSFWYRNGLRDTLIFAVLTQCLVLTLFFDLFLALPVITQTLWLAYFFMPAIYVGRPVSEQLAAG